MVEPVNDSVFISGWLTIASPVILPVPNTTFTTPGGNPKQIN